MFVLLPPFKKLTAAGGAAHQCHPPSIFPSLPPKSSRLAITGGISANEWNKPERVVQAATGQNLAERKGRRAGSGPQCSRLRTRLRGKKCLGIDSNSSGAAQQCSPIEWTLKMSQIEFNHLLSSIAALSPEQIKRLHRKLEIRMAAATHVSQRDDDPLLGSMADLADLMDEIVEDAMRHREQQPWRLSPSE